MEKKQTLLTNTCAFVSMTTTHPIIASCVGPVLGENEEIKIRIRRHILCLFFCDLGRLLKTCDDGYVLGKEENNPRFHVCLEM